MCFLDSPLSVSALRDKAAKPFIHCVHIHTTSLLLEFKLYFILTYKQNTQIELTDKHQTTYYNQYFYSQSYVTLNIRSKCTSHLVLCKWVSALSTIQHHHA